MKKLFILLSVCLLLLAACQTTGQAKLMRTDNRMAQPVYYQEPNQPVIDPSYPSYTDYFPPSSVNTEVISTKPVETKPSVGSGLLFPFVINQPMNIRMHIDSNGNLVIPAIYAKAMFSTMGVSGLNVYSDGMKKPSASCPGGPILLSGVPCWEIHIGPGGDNVWKPC